jgi:hypothetical protein
MLTVKYAKKSKSIQGSKFRANRIPLGLAELIEIGAGRLKPGSTVKVNGGKCFSCGANEWVQVSSRQVHEELVIVEYACLACGQRDTDAID